MIEQIPLKSNNDKSSNKSINESGQIETSEPEISYKNYRNNTIDKIQKHHDDFLKDLIIYLKNSYPNLENSNDTKIDNNTQQTIDRVHKPILNKLIDHINTHEKDLNKINKETNEDIETLIKNNTDVEDDYQFESETLDVLNEAINFKKKNIKSLEYQTQSIEQENKSQKKEIKNFYILNIITASLVFIFMMILLFKDYFFSLKQKKDKNIEKKKINTLFNNNNNKNTNKKK